MNSELKVKGLRMYSNGQLDKITGRLGDKNIDWVIDRMSGIIIINSGDNTILNESDFRNELELVLSSWESLRIFKDKVGNICKNYVLHDGSREFGKLSYDRKRITNLVIY